MKVIKESFGEINHKEVNSYTLINDKGMEIRCINYGCIITKIIAPDKHGNFENVVLGYDTLEEYLTNTSYFGAIAGRVAGRIKAGTFKLDEELYTLPKNENNNHLHGGFNGFNKLVWDATVVENELEIGVRFSYLSPDGEEGYPGNLKISVTYFLNNDNELIIEYNGICDQKTLLNVTNHSYFNLSGNLKRDILDHSLMIKSDKFLELNDELLPTGNMLSVENTAFDFRKGRLIKAGVLSNDPQNVLAGDGYDHPFILNKNHNHEIVLTDQESGRVLTIETDEVGVVVYSGNQLTSEGEIRNVPSKKHLGICLETQGLPDAINHPQFPSWILDKDKKFTSVTKYKFSLTE